MDYEEKLLKQMNQLKTREDNNSGQHRLFGGVEILLDFYPKR